MARQKYQELLRDSRWQELRSRVLQRDGRTCTYCDRSERIMHVHHKYYLKGANPWEYPLEALCTLCPACHASLEQMRAELRSVIAEMGRHELAQVVAYAKAIQSSHCEDEDVLQVEELEQLEGTANAVGLRAEELLDLISSRKSVGRRDLLELEKQTFRRYLRTRLVKRLAGREVRNG